MSHQARSPQRTRLQRHLRAPEALARPVADDLDVPPRHDPEVHELLREARALVGMDVAFVSRFAHGRRIIEVVDPAEGPPLHPGDSDALEDTYCQLIVDGRLPQAVPDARANPISARLDATSALDVGAHTGVPIVLDDGTLYGTLCAYSNAPQAVDDRDTAILVLIARSIAQHLSRTATGLRRREQTTARVTRLLAADELQTSYQPIVDVVSGQVRAVEALARFPASSGRTTAQWFADAAHAGMSETLELASLRCALQGLPALPPHVALTVNVSAAVMLTDTFRGWLRTADVGRIVLELTEHDVISEAAYARIAAVLAPARQRGMRLAVDDLGAGFASLRHVLSLNPDFLKVDISLVSGIDADPDKRTLCRSLVSFAKGLGAQVVAEGVQTAAELVAVRRLGVHLAQGFFVAPPTGLHELDVTALESGWVGRFLAQDGGADAATLIDEWLLAGASPATVAARLNSTGELTATGKRWSTASVRQSGPEGLRPG